MGQVISVQPAAVGDVAIFTLDRSLTGQDPRIFDERPPGEEDPVERLAHRLFSDPAVTHVQVLSNVVTVSREGGWDIGPLNAARDTIATMFVHYGARDPEELRAEHYNATITHIRV
ncbi:MAG: hypothetical protein J5I28_07910, partial [Acidimicrobiales bacterium]|nr:hypothetical protein [Acidimicrobiales bacterium]